MVKLQYMGVMATGNVEGVGIVEKGKVYEVSEEMAIKLKKNGEWKEVKVENKKKIYDENIGGNKKW